MVFLGRPLHRLRLLLGLESFAGNNMKITFKWFSWWDGTHAKEVAIKTIQQGNPSIPSWNQFQQAVNELNGKKVRMEIKQ